MNSSIVSNDTNGVEILNLATGYRALEGTTHLLGVAIYDSGVTLGGVKARLPVIFRHRDL